MRDNLRPWNSPNLKFVNQQRECGGEIKTMANNSLYTVYPLKDRQHSISSFIKTIINVFGYTV